MAFLAQSPEENQQPGTNQNNQIPLIPTLAGSGGPSSPTTAPSGGTTNTASPGSAPSAPWANINTYLSANQPQSKEVANKISQNFNTAYGDIQNQAAQAERNFTQGVNQNIVGLDDNLFNLAKSNPTQFAKDPNNVAAFQKAYNASYGGPTNFEQTADYSNLQNKIQQAQKNADLVKGGTAGIQTLLENTGTNATPGQSALDTLLLQEQPENFNQISNAAKPFASLTDFLNGKVTNLNNAAAAARTQTNNTGSALQNAFVGPSGVIPTFQNDFNTRLAAARDEATKNAAKYKTDISTGNPMLSQQEALELGIDPTQWTDLLNTKGLLGKTYDAQAPVPRYSEFDDLTNADTVPLANELMGLYGKNPDLSQYFTSQDANTAITPANFASDADYAEAAALAKLTGNPSFLDPSQSKSAGTYNPDLADFDYGSANYDLMHGLTQADQTVLSKTPIGLGGADPNLKNFQNFLADIYTRNQGALNPDQKAFLARVNGGTIPQPPQPPTPPVAPPQNGDTRYNDQNGQFEYYNGTNWITSPPEFRGWDPVSKGYSEHFNYKTGQYDPIPVAKQPGAGVFKIGGGGSTPGVV